MPTFECLNHRGSHEISARKVEGVEGGVDVTFDSVTKTVKSNPSAELLGSTAYFAPHEHCIDMERKIVNRMLADAMHLS